MMTFKDALRYEVYAFNAPKWLPERWVLAWLKWRFERKYKRYLRNLPAAEQLSVRTLNTLLHSKP